MKIFYAIVLVLMVFVSACAQQPSEPAPPASAPSVEPEPEPEPEIVAAPEVVVPETTSEEVRMVSNGGIEPLELTINAGSSVTWIYDAEIVSVLTILKDGVSYITSPVLKAGEKFEHEFTEAGEYTYWAVSYGPQGAKIIVE